MLSPTVTGTAGTSGARAAAPGLCGAAVAGAGLDTAGRSLLADPPPAAGWQPSTIAAATRNAPTRYTPPDLLPDTTPPPTRPPPGRSRRRLPLPAARTIFADLTPCRATVIFLRCTQALSLY